MFLKIYVLTASLRLDYPDDRKRLAPAVGQPKEVGPTAGARRIPVSRHTFTLRQSGQSQTYYFINHQVRHLLGSQYLEVSVIRTAIRIIWILAWLSIKIKLF